MRSTDYISKGTAVARLYKARESLLMDKDCRKGLCFYLRGVDILDYLEEIGIWNLDSFSIEVLWAYEDFINRDSIPEISQKNFYWWDPNDREVRVKAIDLIINKVMKYGEG